MSSSRSNFHASESEHFSPYRTDGKLYGFVCIVTGATQPVGRAIVAELAAHGAACIYACSPSPSDDFQTVIDEANGRFPSTKVIGYPSTATTEEATLTLIDDVLNSWGRLDVYITSSDSLGPSSISSTTSEDLYKVFESNSMAPFFALKFAPPAMAKTTPAGPYPNSSAKDQAYGSIVVVSSIANTHGGCCGPAYTISSHAALGVVRAGVAALKGTGVRINCISPGQIEVNGASQGNSLQPLAYNSPNGKQTQHDFVGLERAGMPSEVARVAGFLSSSFSSYVTGANIIVDGGTTAMSPLTIFN